ncbi:MAG: HD-GYP domain-containing protein [Planctomycetota bacterium]|nr:HD-GYP domain-containing protein [Planctomycetota bacterium]
MVIAEEVDRATLAIAILDDHPAWREFQAQSLKRAGFGRIETMPANPSLFVRRFGEKSREFASLVFGLRVDSEVSWENLRVLRGCYSGPIIVASPQREVLSVADKIREIGAEDVLVLDETDPEAIELKIETVLMTHRIGKVLEENDLRTQRLFVNILTVMVKILESKDPYTKLHSHQVVKWSRMIGRRRGLSDEALTRLGLAAVFHDFGKVGVPEDILNKPSGLSNDEFALMKQHPAIAKNILGSLDQLADILPAIHHHHERWAGGGYPEGLKGEQIPLWARIIGLADAYDTMSSRRTYKEPFPKERIIDELIKASGKQFDPELVAILLELIEEQR